LKVLPVLRDGDFFLPQSRKIYSRMTELFSSGKPIDLVTLSDFLESRGELEAAGGAAYLSQLCDGLPRATNVKHYADIVCQKAKQRAVIHICDDIMQLAEKTDAAELTESAIARFLALTGERQESKIREWNEAADSAITQIGEARSNPKSICRINSGIAKLDD